VRLRHEGDRLDPGERGALAVVEERRFAPRIQRVSRCSVSPGGASIECMSMQ
jgi:hypothetical protein